MSTRQYKLLFLQSPNKFEDFRGANWIYFGKDLDEVIPKICSDVGRISSSGKVSFEEVTNKSLIERSFSAEFSIVAMK